MEYIWKEVLEFFFTRDGFIPSSGSFSFRILGLHPSFVSLKGLTTTLSLLSVRCRDLYWSDLTLPLNSRGPSYRDSFVLV